MTPKSIAAVSDLAEFVDVPENRAVTCHLMGKLKQPLDTMLMQLTTLLALPYLASNSTAYRAAATSD
jgi:hypothetical protein